MPEGLEAEIWRRAAQPLIGRRIERIELDKRVADPALITAVGKRIDGVRRHGKVIVVDTTGPAIGIRFGMTGRLIIDGVAPIRQLEYASGRDRSNWDRIRLWTYPESARDAPAMRMNDPRRLGRVDIDPDLSRLGPDAFEISAAALADSLSGRRTSMKAALMNQEVVAGLGNLCVDEVLFSAGISPMATVDAVGDAGTHQVWRAMRRRLPVMLERGGSIYGVIDPERRRNLGRCPFGRCNGSLRSDKVGGRTTVWCPAHQLVEFC